MSIKLISTMEKIQNLFGDLYRLILATAFRLLPIKSNKIVFTSYYGASFGDNPGAIYQALLEKGQKTEVVWVYKQKPFIVDANIQQVKYSSIAHLFHLMTAKVWVDNCRKHFYLFKRKQQLYIQTWHGGGGQKRCEADVEDKIGRRYVLFAKRDSKNADIFISESKFMTELYYKSFWYSGYVYECGYPRYDLFFKDNECLKEKIYSYYRIDSSKKIVLYAPTFRVDNSFSAYSIDFKRILKVLNDRFSNEFVFLVHLHPNVANIKGCIEYNNIDIINATSYPDMQELLAVADVLIGDYSSLNYDFCIRGQPVFRFVTDLEDYKKDRDFYIDFEEYPFPYASNNEELERVIREFDYGNYEAALARFFEQYGAVFANDSSEKVANLICDYLKTKKKESFMKKHLNEFV